MNRPSVYHTTDGRTAGGRRKLQVADQRLADELIVQGARLIADYGSFKLFDVQAETAEKFSQFESVQERDEENLIQLNAGAFDALKAEAQQRRGRRASPSSGGPALHLIQFAGPVKPEWFQELLTTGVSVVSYLPNNAYLVYGDDRQLTRMQSWAGRRGFVQWDGEYESGFKLDPGIYAAPRNEKTRRAAGEAVADELYAVQMVADDRWNQETLQLIAALKSENIRVQFRMRNYLNLVVKLPLRAVEKQLAARPDVVSITRYPEPVKFDERQDMIMAGNLSGSAPAPGDYLTYLAVQGFTQSQFTASGFAVNLSDSGIDNATISPRHFALYVNGNPSGQSRVIYNRLEGTPHSDSTLQGCDGHGNLNAHIIAGFVPSFFNAFPHTDNNGFRFGLGVAPFVRVGSSVIFDPSRFTFPNFADLEAQAYQGGARISSNSWGSNTGGGYNIDAQAYDALARDAQPVGAAFAQPGNQQMVIVFAAGNQGPLSQSVGAPGSAKNVITAGAAESVNLIGSNDACNVGDDGANSANDIASFSGRGPTSDGRRKPDLVAPGTHISGGVAQADSPGSLGTANPCYLGNGICGGPGGAIFFPSGQQFYSVSSGTSHSTPAIAGAAALVRQRFINAGLNPPSPAMTKAVLMNTARYLNGVDANDNLWSDNQGMGEVNLTSSFNLVGGPAIIRDQAVSDLFTSTGQIRAVTGNVADGTRPFRVTLAWTDAPGPTFGNAYVNNLNLEVTIGGQTYLGNVFSGASSATGGSSDPRNNVESVFIPAGVTGPFVVRVIAANIAGDGVPNVGGVLDQDYALVINNANETAQAVLTSASSPIAAEGCSPGNGAVDPGETVTVNFALRNIGTANAGNVVATLQPSGGVINPSGPQTYGALTAGGSAVSKSFTFKAGGTCGGTLVATLSVQDGANNLGVVSYSFNLGTAITNLGSFNNTAAITIPAGAPGVTSGAATPYPSTINVSGLVGTVSKLTVNLNNLNHTFPDDIDILLVGPTGKTTLLMSDVGGDADLSNIDLTFDDAAAPLPDLSSFTSGSYRPSNYGGLADAFPAPAPGGPYPEPPLLSGFNGTSPNGVWSLSVVDDGDADTGSILGGWSLTITTSLPACCSATGCPTITVSPANLPIGVTGTPFMQTFTQSGGAAPVGFGVTGQLPAGLMMTGAALSGTPTQNGVFDITVTAVDANSCIGNRNYQLKINCPSITIDPPVLPAATLGAPYSQTITQTGGIGPVVFTVSGSLPAGMVLSDTGLLSGTPTQQGNFSFTVTATDANQCANSRNYNLTVTGLQYYALSKPIRLLDTRPGESGCVTPGTPLTAGASRTQLARLTCDGVTIPASALAIAGNATVVNNLSGPGFITLYPTGAQQPTVSNLNYLANQIVPNAFTVGLGSNGEFDIFATSTTHLIIDVTGYYAPPGTAGSAGSGGLYYHPLPIPIRLLDTRFGESACAAPGAPLQGGAIVSQQARLTCNGVTIPANAKAVVGNGTVVNFLSGGGFITLYPTGAQQPTVSNLNYLSNQIIPNAFTVGLSAGGEFNIFASSSTNFIVDVTGYFSPDAVDLNGAGLLYFPLPRPIRLLDTRPGETACDAPGAPLQANSPRIETARLTCDGITIPTSAQAVVGNATVVNFLSGGGFITLYPTGALQPTVSNLNYLSNQIIPNAFTVGLGSAGQFNIFATSTTHFIVDLAGYFAP